MERTINGPCTEMRGSDIVWVGMPREVAEGLYEGRVANPALREALVGVLWQEWKVQYEVTLRLTQYVEGATEDAAEGECQSPTEVMDGVLALIRDSYSEWEVEVRDIDVITEAS